MPLPPDPDWVSFDALHDDPEAWRADITAIARRHGGGAVQLQASGTVLVAFVGVSQVLKLYPPFLRDHHDFERAMLQRLHGRLHLPTPELLASDSHQGWPYLLMSRLHGAPLTDLWPTLSEAQRLSLLAELGQLTTEVHALPVGEIADLAPAWPDFVAGQRQRCRARQQRAGLAPHLLAQVDAFVSGPLPQGPPVLLTGEYTPMNLLADPERPGRLAAMYDFGDGLVGPRAYDWLGPLAFLCAGHAERCHRFLEACGVTPDEALMQSLLRLLLLHRYSAPPVQIRCDGWQDEPGFEAVAARIWPLRH